MGAPFAAASSHREAPAIAADPYADLTDLYAFVSPDAPDTVTFIVNAIPYEDPMGGPNYYKFDDKVKYVLHIAQAGHNQDDIKYSVEFKTTLKNPATFLYNFGPYSNPPAPDNTNNAGGISGTPAVSAMAEGEGWFYAGQRADPFFLDLGVFDLLALRPLQNL